MSRLPDGQPPGREQQNHPQNYFVDVWRQFPPASLVSERDREQGKGPKSAPGKAARTRVPNRSCPGDEQIQHQCGGLHHSGCDAEQGHGRQVARRASVADRRIKQGGDEDEQCQHDAHRNRGDGVVECWGWGSE